MLCIIQRIGLTLLLYERISYLPSPRDPIVYQGRTQMVGMHGQGGGAEMVRSRWAFSRQGS